MLQNQNNNWTVPVILIALVGATIYLSVINNRLDIVENLAIAIFGYYFGVNTGPNNGPKPPII